jgi:hypothetical protein
MSSQEHPKRQHTESNRWISGWLSRDPLGDPSIGSNVVSRAEDQLRSILGTTDTDLGISFILNPLSRDSLKNAEFTQGANLYWYVQNNAVNMVDPTGLITQVGGPGPNSPLRKPWPTSGLPTQGVYVCLPNQLLMCQESCEAQGPGFYCADCIVVITYVDVGEGYEVIGTPFYDCQCPNLA